MTDAQQTVLPRWRGFNLLEMFTVASSGDFQEDDFRWIRDWGFDFVRIPACYTLWIDDDDWYRISEAKLEKIDRVVRLGGQYGLHVSFNFHRGPGYSVNRERDEPLNLWKDQDALDAFCLHWKTLAERYRGISSKDLSFDLVNEPPPPGEGRPPLYPMTRLDHERVVRAAVAAIHDVDPDRLVVAGGGVGVHCGEAGAFNRTPHDVVLAWFEDVLRILTPHKIGYALWNFRGPFGIIDSGRTDVDYEAWHGHRLDREYLSLLQRY